MIKKLLFSSLITLLFVTNVFASNNSVTINVKNNVANITLSGLDKNVNALQLDIVDENGNTNVNFSPDKNFKYQLVKESNNSGKTTISIVLDDNNLTQNGTLNIGILTFKNKPNLSKNVKLELVNLDADLKGKLLDVVATVNVDDTTTSNNNNTSNNSSTNGAIIGTTSNNDENNKTENNISDKKEPTKIDINAMYPVVKQSNFSDISNHWANEPIKYLADRGIINGMNDTTFAPNNNITRAEFITLLAKMDNIDINKYKAENFIDVSKDAWFNPYVDWAAKSGITSGITSTTFAPNDNITREQMAVMIERFCNYKNFSLNKNKEQLNFIDTNNISSYASSSIAKVQQAGIINGRPDGSFAPKSNATRGESAQMLYTMLTIQ
ncbi:S-layer homology domain-containing protein [uncultured Tyzzerella sp.]|uniref:S-layer homology domain-containing protein n=1 Tax=uncultured Tyzzerella sp. TaxID=2321398 RepID=UPI00294202CC|nr:S-layer homology domain-containing protein [uncultured Tyzzerella sp.]